LKKEREIRVENSSPLQCGWLLSQTRSMLTRKRCNVRRPTQTTKQYNNIQMNPFTCLLHEAKLTQFISVPVSKQSTHVAVYINLLPLHSARPKVTLPTTKYHHPWPASKKTQSDDPPT